jgi:cell division protein FtsN
MTRDYKAREEAPRPRRRRAGASCFFWFVSGALLGALGVAIAWMMQGFQDQATAPSEAPKQTQAAPKPRFDYAKILPELEVVVTDDELATDRPPALPTTPPLHPADKTPPPADAAATPPATPADAAQPAAGGKDSYLIQIASFKARSDADRLKAQLALMGVQAQIQQVTINGKDTYHRVRSGPYSGKEAVNKTRAMLKGKGLDSIAIKLK